MKARRIGTVIAAIAVLSTGLLGATPAGAAFPGSNGRIVFSRYAAGADGDWEIYTISASGHDLERLTDNGVDDDYPSWSADGTKIVFMRKVNGEDSKEIFVMDADGSDPVRLTNNSVNDADPSWSPDGTKIVFSRRVGGPGNNDWEIMKMDADGSHVVQLTDNETQDYGPVFSPDGTLLAFSGTAGRVQQITTITPTGTNRQALTNCLHDCVFPDWSPDGTKIVFQRHFPVNPQIFTMDADGTDVVQFTNNGVNAEPAWSPDGNQIAFTRYGADWIGHLYTKDATGGGGLTALTDGPPWDSFPDWQAA